MTLFSKLVLSLTRRKNPYKLNRFAMSEVPISSTIYSQSNAFEEILSWSEKRPNWQRDALRRLVRNGSLSLTDLDELEVICLTDNSPIRALLAEDISSGSSPEEPISLLSVENPIGINALAEDQSLKFSSNGLTLVYGDNGSGKSGYVRVLKNACRSRDAKQEILRNVNSNANTAQSAKIRFTVGTNEKEFDWGPATESSQQLPSVSIFDARSANTHVQAENSVAYIPFPMEVLESLANACDVLKERLDNKVTEIVAKTPNTILNSKLQPQTSAGAFLGSLSHSSNLATLDVLASLNDDEMRRLATIEADLAQDPKKVITKLTTLKSRLSSKSKSLSDMVEVASEVSCNNYKSLGVKYNQAVAVAKAASEKLFESSPLPDIGNEIWRALWESARNYSDQVAYKEKSFPEAIADSDLCVLCQQPLSQHAVDRRLTFEEFVKSTAKSDEQTTFKKFNDESERFKTRLLQPSFTKDFCNFIRDELENSDYAKLTREVSTKSALRLRAALRGQEMPTAVMAFPKQQLDTLMAELDLRITQLSADESSPVRIALKEEYQNLKDRSLLAIIKEDVIDEIERKKQVQSLKDAIKSTAKRSVTAKNKELSDKLVTDALRARFAREVEKLKIGTIPLELKKIRDKNAQSYFRVEFVGYPGRPVGEILSEGEHRCVALAAFLAELVTSREYSGIVFDDPMSSLDHLYRENVAVRLVEEAEHRQVVVFTHDLGFMWEVIRRAEAAERPIDFQSVSRRNKTCQSQSKIGPINRSNRGPLFLQLSLSR